MQHEVFIFMADICESANRIKEYLSACPTYYTFAANFMMRDAVERRLSIIGKALYQAGKFDRDLPITDKQKIIALRHILIHEYHRAEPDRLWILCHAPLDILLSEVNQIINNNSSADAQADF